MELPERIGAIVLDLYDKLPRNGKPVEISNRREYTVLAGFVAEIKNEIGTSTFKVISLGTGTKCLNRNEVNSCGLNLSDTHAEVIARRGFIRYLYSWADKCFGQHQVCEAIECPFIVDSATKIIHLKDCWYFHMYISDSPCGDASIYEKLHHSKYLESTTRFTGAKVLDLHERKFLVAEKEVTAQSFGVLRGKCGRGDIDPSLRSTSMSCSDKLLRWTALGIQGSLFTMLGDAIYLSSLTVSKDPLASKEAQLAALERALVTRFNINTCLPSLASARQVDVYICDVIFEEGKTATEAAIMTIPPPIREPEKGKDRNSKARKIRTGYPANSSINWIVAIEGAVNRRGLINSSGSLEIVTSSTGYLQGAGKKRRRDEREDQLLMDDPITNDCFGFQSSLSRYELSVLFLHVLHSKLVVGFTTRNLTLYGMKLLNEEYRSRRAVLLAHPFFSSYLTDDPAQNYAFKLE